jgi:hypothetical protein
MEPGPIHQIWAWGLSLLSRGSIHMPEDQEPAGQGASTEVERLATWPLLHMTRGARFWVLHPKLNIQWVFSNVLGF